jgi:beta-glucanase (GH16 family)
VTVAATMTDNWDTVFHEYAMEHSETHLAFVYDGQTVLNVSVSSPSKPLFWDMPFYLILNTAVGGSWPSPVSDRTVFPTYFHVDYVKVAQHKEP